MFDPESRFVEANGVCLAVSEAGVGGRPLLLVHGFTGTKEDFGDHLDALAESGWWVVAVDNRGHGMSDKPDDEDAYSFEIFADDVIAVVDALGWDRFSLLGHSMGGMVAQVVATLIGDRIERLILMDTAHGPLPLADDATVAAARHIISTRGMDGLADAVAELALIPDAGHSPQIENPDAWWEALSTFLAEEFWDETKARQVPGAGTVSSAP